MKSWSETDVFAAWELRALARARAIVEAIPDELSWMADYQPLRCHEVARIVGRILGFPVVDGAFGAVDHSWVLLELDGVPQRQINVLDPYAVGSMPQVQLVDVRALLPHREAYRERDPRTDVDDELVEILARAVTVALSQDEDATQGLEGAGRTGLASLPAGT